MGLKQTAGTNLAAADANKYRYLYDRINTNSGTTIANTTTETDLYVKTILGGDLSASGVFDLDLEMEYKNDNSTTHNFTLRLKLGSTTLSTAVMANSTIGNSTNGRKMRLRARIGNDGSVSSQSFYWELIGYGNIAGSDITIAAMSTAGSGIVGAASGTSAVNTASNQDLKVTAQFSVANASISVRLLSARLIANN